MTRPSQNGHLCPGALSGTTRELLAAAVEIFRRDQRQAGFGGCPRQASSEIAHHWLSGRSVQCQDCPAQIRVRARSHFPCYRRGHAQALVPLGSGLGRQRLPSAQPPARRLPPSARPAPCRARRNPDRSTPKISLVQDRIRLWTVHCDAYDVPPTPVMPHEIDRLCQLPEFAGKPIAISVSRTVKAGRELRSQIRVETDEQRHRCADAGRDRPRSPPFQDFRERERWSSEFLRNDLVHNRSSESTSFQIMSSVTNLQ